MSQNVDFRIEYQIHNLKQCILEFVIRDNNLMQIWHMLNDMQKIKCH